LPLPFDDLSFKSFVPTNFLFENPLIIPQQKYILSL